MKYFYDSEFIEDGSTIKLISIGIVADDGRELYLVNQDIKDDEGLYRRITGHSWLMANVVPHLPLRNNGGKDDGFIKLDGRVIGFVLDHTDNRIVSPRYIRNAVRDFLLQPNEPVELWGYYSAYDHVLLAQLFGPMVNLPRGIPMWTNDVVQEAARLGLEHCLPAQTGTAHNALDDARWTREAWAYLASKAAS